MKIDKVLRDKIILVAFAGTLIGITGILSAMMGMRDGTLVGERLRQCKEIENQCFAATHSLRVNLDDDKSV